MRCEGLVSSDCYAEENFILMCGKITHLYQYQKTNDKPQGYLKFCFYMQCWQTIKWPATTIPTAEDIKIQE